VGGGEKFVIFGIYLSYFGSLVGGWLLSGFCGCEWMIGCDCGDECFGLG